MSFRSAYSGTERISLPGDYWVDVKTCLSRAEQEEAERLLTQATVQARADGSDARMTGRPDTARYRTYMVQASVVAWNLDEDDGTVIPITPDEIRALPSPVFDLIWTRVNTLNEPLEADAKARFPRPDLRGDSHGRHRPGLAQPLPAGTQAVAGAGTPPR